MLTRINPLTYAVAPLRDIVFAARHMPQAGRGEALQQHRLVRLHAANTACVGITCAFAVTFGALAVTGFGKPD